MDRQLVPLLGTFARLMGGVCSSWRLRSTSSPQQQPHSNSTHRRHLHQRSPYPNHYHTPEAFSPASTKSVCVAATAASVILKQSPQSSRWASTNNIAITHLGRSTSRFLSPKSQYHQRRLSTCLLHNSLCFFRPRISTYKK